MEDIALNGMLMTALIFLPLVVGFVLLFCPRRLEFVPEMVTFFIAVLSLVLASWIFGSGLFFFGWSVFVLRISAISLDLLLRPGPLGSFMLLFACVFV